ncbi:MAG: bifunctional folylpolyglutamate synthase/dihydrofolate synthase [Candidatus Hydrogenedentes bacterium]|nr:bifunctional folylpolyglutamate synthase/dihydrofolate synthase [Candidatus Hydrogenedentota bacterium]
MTPRDFLASLEFHGIKLGIDNIRRLLDVANNPQRGYPVIHVAGTNGKGSVVAFAASILRAAGLRVGRFTSPHLLDVSERFLIDATPIADVDLDRHIDFFRGASHELPNPPTYFEVCTAIALRHFAECKVDVAVIEVGMGGRFDSTNVVEPEVCAITNIALDHQKYLGNTLEEIAFEKAGVIKTGVPVVVGECMPGPFDVIETVARECNAPIKLKGRDFTFAVGGDPLSSTLSYRGPTFNLTDAPISLAGMHQVENAALAVALMESVQRNLSITESAIVRGLADTQWPCRLERVLDDPPVYIDVAHNPAGIQRIVESMPPCVVVFAASSDKDVGEMLREIAPLARKLILTEFEGSRATPADKLSAAAGAIPHEMTTPLRDAIAVGMKEASAHCPLLITGSIFTAGQARRMLASKPGARPLRF